MVHYESDVVFLLAHPNPNPTPTPNPNPTHFPAFTCQVDSAWRARLLVYASIEDTGPREPKHQRMPMILSQSMLDDIEPETEPHLLRCDLYEAVGWNLPPASALYLVLAWGPNERKSKSNTPANGKIL